MNSELSTLRQQLSQLADQHQKSAIDGEAYEQARKALESQIIANVMESEMVGAMAKRRPSIALMAGLSAIVLLGALASFMWLRAPDVSSVGPATSATTVGLGMLATANANGDKAGGHTVDSAQIAAMTSKLAARLNAQPDDGDGWAMLARTYAVTGHHADAVPAFQKAMALKKDDPVLLTDYADALAVTRSSRLEGEPLVLVEQALSLDPDNVKALSLAGSAAFERKDFAAAIEQWEKLLRVAPPDSPFVQRVKDGIADARQMSAKTP